MSANLFASPAISSFMRAFHWNPFKGEMRLPLDVELRPDVMELDPYRKLDESICCLSEVAKEIIWDAKKYFQERLRSDGVMRRTRDFAGSRFTLMLPPGSNQSFSVISKSVAHSWDEIVVRSGYLSSFTFKKLTDDGMASMALEINDNNNALYASYEYKIELKDATLASLRRYLNCPPTESLDLFLEIVSHSIGTLVDEEEESYTNALHHRVQTTTGQIIEIQGNISEIESGPSESLVINVLPPELSFIFLDTGRGVVEHAFRPLPPSLHGIWTFAVDETLERRTYH